MSGLKGPDSRNASLGCLVDMSYALYWRPDYASAYFARGNVQRMRGNQIEFIKDWLRAFILPLDAWTAPEIMKDTRQAVLSGRHSLVKNFTVRGQWKQMPTEGIPGVHPDCAFPCVGVSDDDIAYLFGGEVGDAMADKSFNADFSCFDMVSEKWLPHLEVGPGLWPPARSKGSLCCWQGGVYMWGGHTQHKSAGIVWRFDVGKKLWEKIRVKGPHPEDRFVYNHPPPPASTRSVAVCAPTGICL